MKIENRSRKCSHKLDGIISVGSISSDFVYDSVSYDPVKIRLSESEADAEEPINRKTRIQTLSLVCSSASACDCDNVYSFHLIVSDGVINRVKVLLPTLSV